MEAMEMNRGECVVRQELEHIGKGTLDGGKCVCQIIIIIYIITMTTSTIITAHNIEIGNSIYNSIINYK